MAVLRFSLVLAAFIFLPPQVTGVPNEGDEILTMHNIYE